MGTSPTAYPGGPLLREEGRRPVRSVYVHAPYCARRCGYCDFAVTVRRRGGAEQWARALTGELAALHGEGLVALGSTLETLYVGGGTPSLLGPDAMRLLAGAVGPERLHSGRVEWTAEANPESLTDEVATGWRAAGVNRVSLGVQSFEENALRWMGRLHGPDGARAAVASARRAGLENLSIDLMFALPDGVQRSWTVDLDRALALELPHLSLYGLTAEPGTPYGRALREGRARGAGGSRYRDEYLEACERLVSAGYHHYEVSSFARPGAESRHNRVYWSGEPYLGLGNSAHSYLPPLRRWNLRDWSAYECAARQGRLPLEDQEVLAPEAERLERVWLGLRATPGLPTHLLSSAASALAEDWRRRGWARAPSPDFVSLTAEGWLQLDRLAVDLDSVLEREVGM